MSNRAKKKEVFIEGMHCDSCEVFVESIASKEDGVKNVIASSKTSTITISVDSESDYEKIIESIDKKISSQGYHVKKDNQVGRLSNGVFIRQYLVPILLGAALMFLFHKLIGESSNLTNLVSGNFSLYSALILGFVASISTCMAVVGGVAITFAASVTRSNQKQAITYFHASRVLGFILLGGVAGYIGKLFVISGYYSRIVEIIISLMMILVGLDMMGIKIISITFPKKLSRKLGLFSESDKTLSGALLGISTFFLPCGMTQAVQVQALVTGSFFRGAGIMGAFAIGSLPVLLLLSSSSSKASSLVKNKAVQNFLAGIIVANSVTTLLTILL